MFNNTHDYVGSVVVVVFFPPDDETEFLSFSVAQSGIVSVFVVSVI